MEEHHDKGSNMMIGVAREQREQHDDRGSKRKSMSIAINDKGGDCWSKLKLSLMSIIDDNGQSQGNPKMDLANPEMKDYGLAQTTWNAKGTETSPLI